MVIATVIIIMISSSSSSGIVGIMCFPANGTRTPAGQLAQPTPTVRPISMSRTTTEP